MKKMLIFLLLPVIAVLIFGCEKEKIITSTEYIHDIEYLEGPTDTVFVMDTLVRVDTLVQHDSTIVYTHDTIIIVDTIVVASTDTLFITEYVFDTVTVHDTVTVVETIYDTITIVDTVVMEENLPHVNLAFASMGYHADQEVLDFIKEAFGYSDGWVYYLSLAMTFTSSPSTGIYDFYGYIDYWTPDWSGYYLLEYYWRMTYLGGEPTDPNNWRLSDPPAGASGRAGGLKLSVERKSK